MTFLIEDIKKFLFSIPGWHTNRKIIVFESDDWGMIRMASKSSYNYFLSKGLPVDSCVYNSNDVLEQNTDLELLFEVLSSVRDKNNHTAILTANNVVANPDFEKIQEDNFTRYYLEPFSETLKKYNNREKVLELYQEGIRNYLFRPQFHAREHLNVSNWMKALINKERTTMMAFERQMFSVHAKGKVSSCKDEFLDAFGNFEEDYSRVVEEGLQIFQDVHGFNSTSFIAPCFYWSNSLNKLLRKNGVKYLQGGRVQKSPVHGKKEFKKYYHYLGQRNSLNQLYLIRNASFEVVESTDRDWVDSCMKEIATAFKYKKAAIVSVHRVNFMGGINSKNRSRTLKLFKNLLKSITKTWSDVEFMSSDQLGETIENDSKY